MRRSFILDFLFLTRLTSALNSQLKKGRLIVSVFTLKHVERSLRNIEYQFGSWTAVATVA